MKELLDTDRVNFLVWRFVVFVPAFRKEQRFCLECGVESDQNLTALREI